MIPNNNTKIQSDCRNHWENFPKIRHLFITCRISILLLGLSLIFISCRQTSTIDLPPSRPFANQSLRIFLAKGNADLNLIQEVTIAWERRTGAKVTFTNDFSPDTDIVIFDAKDLVQFAHNQTLRRVPNDIQGLTQSFHWEELLGVYPNQLLLWGELPVAVPIIGEGRVFAYRLDFFDGQQGRPANPPKTWEEVITCAELFGDACLPALGATTAELETEWFSIAACSDAEAISRLPGNRLEDSFFDFFFDAKTAEVRITAPAFLDSLRVLQTLQKYRSKDLAPVSFSKGEAKMGAITLKELQQIEPAIRSKLGFVCLPGTSFYYDNSGKKEKSSSGRNLIPYQGWGAVLGGVTTQCPVPEVGWNLLYEFCHPERATFQIIASGLWGAGPIRLSHVQRSEQSDPIVLWQGYSLPQGSTFMLVDSLRQYQSSNTINGRTVLRTANRKELMQSLELIIRPVILSGADPIPALQQLERDWKSQIEKFPNWRTHYRLSLGL